MWHRILSDELNMQAHITPCVAVFDFNENDSHPPPSLVTSLAPCDFFLFPKIKLKIKGRRFESTEDIQAESQDVMKMLTQNGFQQCFRSWKSG
jgi:hypothetical protein